MKYLETYSNDPEYNLSFEEYCFKYLPLEQDEYFFLWINQPSIIIGKNQNAYQEINATYVEERKLKVVRRITGGGAVYHDYGNLNFSFVTKTKGNEKIDFKRYYTPIIEAFHRIGVNAELSGRNDVTIEGQKCIGASQSVSNGRVLSNGCILFDVQLGELSKALNVRKEKLEAKGVKSVRARVTNVKPYLRDDISIDTFKKELLKIIFELAGEVPTQYVLTDNDKEGIDKIYKERFSKREWNYGASISAEYSKYQRFAIGSIETLFNVKDGKLSNLKIMGDFFGTKDVAEIEKLLTNVPYSKEEIAKKLNGVDLSAYFGALEINELIELLFKETE